MTIIGSWEKVKPLVERWRNVYDDPLMHKSLEYLYDETKKKHPKVHYQLGEQSIAMRERWLAKRDQQ